jgi:myo-inositol-1(or 4)-monophosphatase
MNDETLLESAVEMARTAGALLLEHAASGVEVERKGDVDLVTLADRASEAFLVGEIRRLWPGHGILAEEGGGGAAAAADQPLWVVDPLDGTTNFAHGVPIWAVSIGILRGREPVAGVVHDPSRDECFTAVRGGGAFRDGRPIRVSGRSALGDALLVTGFPYDVRTARVDNLDHFTRFMKKARAVRRLGSAALDLAWVASGRFDGFWELKLHPWDVAAGALLVAEAGGVLCRFGGEPFDPFADEIVAASPALAPQMLRVLSEGIRPADEQEAGRGVAGGEPRATRGGARLADGEGVC